MGGGEGNEDGFGAKSPQYGARLDESGKPFRRQVESRAFIALAVWGLGVDDIAVASFHGTSTKLNDLNESEVTQKQMEHLGRSEGNPLLVVAQKWLTGHPKGAAAAWMTNGVCQSLTTISSPTRSRKASGCGYFAKVFAPFDCPFAARFDRIGGDAHHAFLQSIWADFSQSVTGIRGAV